MNKYKNDIYKFCDGCDLYIAYISPNQRSFSFSIKLLSDTLLRFTGNSVQSHISFFLYLYVLLYSLKSNENLKLGF